MQNGPGILARLVIQVRPPIDWGVSGCSRHRHQFVPVMIDRVIIGAPHVGPAGHRSKLLASRLNDDTPRILIVRVGVLWVPRFPFHSIPRGSPRIRLLPCWRRAVARGIHKGHAVRSGEILAPGRAVGRQKGGAM